MRISIGDSLQDFERMVTTKNEEVHKRYRFRLLGTFLTGAAEIFKECVEHKIHRISAIAQNDYDRVPPRLESYLFGGAIGWRSMTKSNEVFLS